jgi:superfamily I DNA/RNA helicase
MSFADMNKVPKFDALFVDEAQDLMPEEVALLRTFSGALFFVGDDRQKIYTHTVGIEAVRGLTPSPSEERLPFHYRLAPQICDMADRIKPTESGTSLSSTSHYTGPKPGKVDQHGPMSRRQQVNECIELLKEQLRAYGDFIQQGDRLGIVVPKKIDRDFVLKHINSDKDLVGKAQIIRAKSGDSEDRDFDPSFDPDCPISILTEKGSKGLEFRTVHWLFCDEVQIYKSSELYYTVVTRAKTRLDMYFSKDLPDTLARAYAPAAPAEW